MINETDGRPPATEPTDPPQQTIPLPAEGTSEVPGPALAAGEPGQGADARPPHNPDPHPEPGTLEERATETDWAIPGISGGMRAGPDGGDDRPESEGASAGQRVADAVPSGDMGRAMAAPGRGLADEDARLIAEGVFLCLAPTNTSDETAAEACGGKLFERAKQVELTTHGDEANVIYTCTTCSAGFRFDGAPVPIWIQVVKPGWQQ